MQLNVHLPDDLADLVAGDNDRFEAELRLAAAAKWYEAGRLSQERAASLAGLSRAEFIEALSRVGVSAIQLEAEELDSEFSTP